MRFAAASYAKRSDKRASQYTETLRLRGDWNGGCSLLTHGQTVNAGGTRHPILCNAKKKKLYSHALIWFDVSSQKRRQWNQMDMYRSISFFFLGISGVLNWSTDKEIKQSLQSGSAGTPIWRKPVQVEVLSGCITAPSLPQGPSTCYE